jgi:hypothetical protein
MKILERQDFPGGLGGSHPRVRVVEMDALPEVKEGEPCPDLTRVADDVMPFDWMPEIHAPKAPVYVGPAETS